MKESQQQTLPGGRETLVVGGEETTLVSPRFDSEETLVARPVVPLADDALPSPEYTAAGPAPGKRSNFAPRRSGMLVLALACVLVGGVLGGAGLYLYQGRSQEPATTTQQQPSAPADAAQAPAAQPAAEVQAAPTDAAPAQPSDAQATAAPAAEEPARPARDEEARAAAPAREPETVPTAERRTAPAEGRVADTPRRGKKGERDEEVERRATPRPDANVARAEQPEARQVDTIVYRQRRAERRAERRAARRARRDDDVDRLRRIFEGAPE